MKVKALKHHTHDGKAHEPGEVYEIHPSQLMNLEGQRLATLVDDADDDHDDHEPAKKGTKKK